MNTKIEKDYLPSKEVAKLIRKRLKAEFPGVKFSVRSDHSAIDISYTDGPCSRAVDAVVSQFSGGGFDGMIDMAYSCSSWLLPDGTAVPAHSSGTEGSMGTVPAFDSERPHPDARLVQFQNKYIFVHRDTSRAYLERVAAAFQAKYGHAAPAIKGDDTSAWFDSFGVAVFDSFQDKLSWERFLQDMVRGIEA